MSPIRRFAAGMAVAAVAVLASAVPASAHDQLVSSTPGDGERLASAPSTVSMTFSGDLLVLDSTLTGAVVLVVDDSGRDWVSGDITVSGNTVTAELAEGMPVAGYQVRWQVVSEDGHPISGVIPFTIGDAEPLTLTGTTGASDETSDAETPPVRSEDQTADESSGAIRALLVGAGGAAIAVLAFALYRFLRRPRTTDTADL